MKERPEISSRARGIRPTLIRSLRAGMKESTIDFGLGQADLPVSEEIRGALRQELEEVYRAPYTANAGMREAREAVAGHVGVEPGEVMLTCGVQEGLAVAIFGLCEPGSEVLVPNPGFPAYANLVRAAGAIPVEYDLRPPEEGDRRWRLSPAEILKKVRSATAAVVLNNPSNPTGSLFERSALQEVLRGLAEQGVAWISDEIYEDYVWSGSFLPARRVAPDFPGLTLSGLSKSHHLMGWRLGWMVGPEELIGALTPLHQHLVTCAPLPAQQAAVVALGNHQEAQKRNRAIFKERRQLALDTLGGLGVIEACGAAGAFYLFLDVRPWLQEFGSTVEMARQLLSEENVMVIPGEGFGDRGLGHLRLAYTIGGQELMDGLDRVRGFLLRHRSKEMWDD